MARAKKTDLKEIGAQTKALKERAKKSEAKAVEAEPEVTIEESGVAVEVAEAEPQTIEAKEEKAKTAEIDALKAENEMLKQQFAEIRAQMAQMQSQPTPQIIQVAANVERVRFLWMGDVADDNITLFGDNGMYARIVGKTGEFNVPKDDLSRIMDTACRNYLDMRWLIVVSGLNDEERESLGVNYKEGELLDRKAFTKMVDLGDKILDIYPQLCDGHKNMVAKHYFEAWRSKNPNVTRETVVALNRMCKEAGVDNEAFATILAEMNEEEAI